MCENLAKGRAAKEANKKQESSLIARIKRLFS